MNRKTGSLVAAILMIAIVPARAQWLNYPTPGIPRLPDGKPNLTAPAPKTADGKPDLSGIWHSDPQNSKYFGDVAVGFRAGEFPIQPWAEELAKKRTAGFQQKERPDANCIPIGVPQYYDLGGPFKIIQEPGLVVILYEPFGAFRQIFLDGRPLPKDPNPTWMGYSVGRLEADTLVIESIGFNGKKWLDQGGHPATDALRTTERFRRLDFGHLDIQFTVDDPKAYTKPWTLSLPQLLYADYEILEFVCNENEKDLKHLVDK